MIGKWTHNHNKEKLSTNVTQQPPKLVRVLKPLSTFQFVWISLFIIIIIILEIVWIPSSQRMEAKEIKQQWFNQTRKKSSHLHFKNQWSSPFHPTDRIKIYSAIISDAQSFCSNIPGTGPCRDKYVLRYWKVGSQFYGSD